MKIRDFCNKYKSFILYLIFGVLTSLVDYSIYLPLVYLLDVPAVISDIPSWTAAMIFAFFTNKYFVFKSQALSKRKIFREFLSFALCRVGSFILELGFLFVTVDIFSYNEIAMKLLISIIAVMLNYIGSKLFVFKK